MVTTNTTVRLASCIVISMGALSWQPLAANAEPASISALQRQHAKLAAELKSLRSSETLVTLRLASADVQEERRQRIENLIQSAVARQEGRAPGTLEERLAIQLSDFDKSMRIHALNGEVEVARVRWVDFSPGGLARYDDRDLRDLDKILAENGLGDELDRLNLSRTQSYILKDADTIVLKEDADRLAYRLGFRLTDPERELRNFGIIPSSTLDNKLDWTVCDGSSAEERLLTGRNQECIVEISVAHDGRLLRIVNRDASGEPMETFEASDYRSVQGVAFPFRTSHIWHAYRGRIGKMESRAVQAIETNIASEVLCGKFDVPSNFRLSQADASPGAKPK